MKNGTLFVVATPIGNLNDLSPRAAEILKTIDFVACEDTRTSSKILNKIESRARKISFHENSNPEKIWEILKIGKNVALISDAGTPNICDPGGKLVAFCAEKNCEIVAVAGPSALTAALSACGFFVAHFEFFGFLPHKKGREKIFKKIKEIEHACVLFESKHRIEKFLKSAIEFFGERKMCVGREISKINEEFLRGNAAEILEILQKNPQKLRGEFAVVVAPMKI